MKEFFVEIVKSLKGILISSFYGITSAIKNLLKK